jgi:hypothetical protein
LAWFTETDRVASVVPEAGLTDSQLPVLEAAAVNDTLADPAALDTVSACRAGAAPPDTAEKLSVEALTVMLPAKPLLPTTRFTGTVKAAPLADRPISPLYVPAVNPDGFTDTVRFWLVVRLPLLGVIESQGVFAEIAAVNTVPGGLELTVNV